MPQIQPQLLDTPIIPLEEQLQSPLTPQTMLEAMLEAMPEPVLQSLPQSKSTIVLPDYMRAMETEKRIYVPASLREGETQLSTSEAKNSRAVTICHWVVEVVNGRFKRDFKLLRQNYSNTTAKKFMLDFEVAAALLNAFHPPIVDRVDAGEIIQQINMFMNTENELAHYIIRNNYNKRRADFQTISIQNDNLNDFPQLTYSELKLISLDD
ncbi:unnamed protein product [Parnassius mnemosyne]|uniref:DDE Tnp4 domain-containing protein n=1 Tax=Parnassius mnemosyne TaxID=213953 RepID=A0AAV1KNR3_9NEOP